MNSIVNHFLQNYMSQHQANNNNNNNSLLGAGPMDWLTNAATFAGVDALLNRYDEENEDKSHFWRNAGLAGALALGYQYYRDHHNRPQQQQLDTEQQLVAQPVNTPYYYPQPQPIDYNYGSPYPNTMIPSSSQLPYYGPPMMPPSLPPPLMPYNTMGYNMPMMPQDPYTMMMLANQLMLQQQQQPYGFNPFQQQQQQYGFPPFAYNPSMGQMPMAPYSVQQHHLFGHHRPF